MIILAWFWWWLSVYLVFCAVDNSLLFSKPPQADPERKKWPRISILIPARNEAHRIEPCLQSLLAQDYPNYEIIVLDDRSTDNTFNLIREYVKRNHSGKLKVVKGRELPRGWLGKPWACYQLAQKARGEWLFYVDADTWHLPETVKRTVQMAENRKADVVSLLTSQVTQTWMEALVIPVMAFHLLSFFPARWALNPKGKWNKFAGVSGQFVFIRQKVYWAFGGHQRVKNEIVEDLNLGKQLVRAGYRLVLGNGSDFSYCRMYTNAKEVWTGFSKNFYPAMGYSFPLLLNTLAVLWINGIAPFVFLLLGPRNSLFYPALALCLTLWAVRLLQAVNYRMNKMSVLFHPMGCLLFSLIGINSFRWFGFKGQGYWKGRILRRITT